MKPVVFLSHSSRDREPLVALRRLILKKTGESIEVFLSSDGQSIPFGKNWVHSIEDALARTAVMFVFLTPNSRNANWLHFEAGYVYSKNVRVVPVGFLGMDLVTLSPPLTLLQGFNITNSESMGNILAVINDVCKHNHTVSISDEDYRAVVSTSALPVHAMLGEYGVLVDNVMVYPQRDVQLGCTGAEALDRIRQVMAATATEYHEDDERLYVHGMRVDGYLHVSPPTVEMGIDASVVDARWALVESLLCAIRTDGAQGMRVVVEFGPTVDCLVSWQKVTGRMFGTDVRLGGSRGKLVRRDLTFDVEVGGSRTQRAGSVVHVGIDVGTRALPGAEIGELLTLLFERGVLFRVVGGEEEEEG